MSILEALETTPHSSRTLTPEISRRVILRVAAEGGSHLFFGDANAFAHTLRGNRKEADYLVGWSDGKIIVDFPNVSLEGAVERVDSALLESQTPADIQEARMEQVPRSLGQLETAAAWMVMKEVTTEAEALVSTHRDRLMTEELVHISYDVA